MKLTHDGAIAVLHDRKLVFSTEMEKLRNNPRYSQVADLDIVPELLADFGYRLSDVDHWVIDGWDGAKTGTAELANHGKPVEITVAPYRENDTVTDLLKPGYLGEFAIGDEVFPYTSYVHLSGHLASAYCSSDFAARGEPSFVLIWDGGTFPRLYWVDPASGVQNAGELFPLIGHTYATAAHHFGPFRRGDESTTVDDLSVAGKLMAYIAKGSPRREVLAVLAQVFDEHFEADTPKVTEYRQTIGGWGSNSEPSLRYVHAFFRDAAERLAPLGVSDEDVLASVHAFLENLLVDRVTAKVRELRGEGPFNLCFVGGCALNIKWNSALRAQAIFRSVWVPPFPNDSGSAIGAACAHLAAQGGLVGITWHARSGPALVPSPRIPDGWTTSPCTPAELAGILHETGQPVVVLNARAELGPRALGGRSIIAPATDPAMKDELNRVKKREDYRPVAPICLTEFAPEIFDPGTPDPHMLFDHQVRADWVDRIPAVLHLDGTARLQTVSTLDDPALETILREYYRLSGIPVLCNTSANHNGSGFFPDVASALEWGRVGLVWSEGTLYRKG
ncbi:nodulation protein NodU [Amycolatopsis anabasis]|uniref:nodulation protein NodU n=1 Tax=Amycolatopsis anabasis TaxID=1840409 RepID=UPI001FE4A048|nr:nodulation protein NodU [Amycolatopsis anabasis]